MSRDYIAVSRHQIGGIICLISSEKPELRVFNFACEFLHTFDDTKIGTLTRKMKYLPTYKTIIIYYLMIRNT